MRNFKHSLAFAAVIGLMMSLSMAAHAALVPVTDPVGIWNNSTGKLYGFALPGQSNTTPVQILNTNTGIAVGTNATPPSAGITSQGNLVFNAPGSTVVLKNGANGKAGTFICTSGGDITVADNTMAITDIVIIGINTVGGTVSTPPAQKSITAATGFHVLCASGDTSTYNWGVISRAN